MYISISELESAPFYYLRCAEQGKVIWLITHQQRVAQLVSISRQELQISTHLLLNISWNGKKPKLPPRIIPKQSQSFAETVLEMR